ncbi:MAG: hypothetical protein SO442_02880 [Prevotella sp.]|nr:hypothetical protein [Prevotella sp.]MDY4625530.1 hypothetical protein [Prevotella sp.]MDY4667847.1 hypothetical protein [Prevotella sp.]MDY5258010.1 hypothetical protein [Prevotella sp.]
MTNKNLEDFYGQMLIGIAQLVNGEGGSGRLSGLALDDNGTAIIAGLNDVPHDFLPALLSEMQEEVTMWRVNPFTNISYDDDQHIRFSLKPDDEIERLYKQSQIQ